jgi:probable F420-dependent oxidoreductase
MKFGFVFPQDITDPVGVRDLVQGLEVLGFDHIVFPDHVIGGNPQTHTLNVPYTHRSFFHEPMVTMGYIAAVTETIELMPGVLILPQRQTALVAKQAAQVDLLSAGRLILGVGVGYNEVEYDVLGVPFHTRGRRIDEQIEVMRALWRNELVNFEGEWHHISDAGINPRPAASTIPIYMGGWADPMIRRIARTGDGWLLYAPLESAGRQCLDKLYTHCDKIGRDPATIEIQSWIFLNHSNVMAGEHQQPGAEKLRNPDEWAREALAWRDAGATRLDCWTMYGGLTTAQQHLAQAEQFVSVMKSLF